MKITVKKVRNTFHIEPDERERGRRRRRRRRRGRERGRERRRERRRERGRRTKRERGREREELRFCKFKSLYRIDDTNLFFVVHFKIFL